MEGQNADAAVNIAVLSQRIGRELAALRELPRDCSIYKAPKELLQGNEFTFKPLLVSIGPYHFEKPELLPMEEHKKRFFSDFIHRTQVNRDDCLARIEQRRVQLRSCYAEQTNHLTNEVFVYMILVDASFIIELFLRLFMSEMLNVDQVTRKPAKVREMQHDLILLENQLPFFILEELFDLACHHIRKPPGHPFPGTLSMINLARIFCQSIWDPDQLAVMDASIIDIRPAHLLDLMRMSFAFPLEPAAPGLYSLPRLITCTATKLYLSGVKFKSSPSVNLFNITFQNGVLTIPKLRVMSLTETLLRNLMVLERLDVNPPFFMNQYIALINFLVNTPQDVEFLTKHEILETLWEPKRVSTLFHNMLLDCVVDPQFYFSDLLDKMEKYCSKRRRKWMANLRQKYLRTPWSTIKVIAAIFAFFIAIAQVISSYLQLKKKYH